MTLLYVCEWNEYDVDGSCEVIAYTDHLTLEEPQKLRMYGCRGYGYLMGKISSLEDNGDEYWEPIGSTTILTYDNNILIGKYELMGDGWRYYEKQEHWNDMYEHLIYYPPVVKNNDYYDWKENG